MAMRGVGLKGAQEGRGVEGGRGGGVCDARDGHMGLLSMEDSVFGGGRMGDARLRKSGGRSTAQVGQMAC